MTTVYDNQDDFNKAALYYLAGPMSGHKQFNIPYFYEVTTILRAQGLRIMNPADLDSDQTRSACLRDLEGNLSSLTESWGDMLARDVKIVADECKGIILLPGWRKSRGARLEAFVAKLAGHIVYEYHDHGNRLEKLIDKELEEGIIGWSRN